MDARKGNIAIKRTYVVALAALVAVIIIGAAYLSTSSAAGSVVASGDNVSVYYTGTFANGTVFGTNVGGQPLNFTVGAGQVITGFNNGIIGMGLNQTKTITLPPDQAYGGVNQSLIVQVPRSDFGNKSIQIGSRIATGTGQQGTITALNANAVTVDFNSPLAGQTLIFQIRVISIRK